MNQHEIDQATAVMAAVSAVIKETVAPLAEENLRLQEQVKELGTQLKVLNSRVAEIPAPVPAQLPVIDLTGFVTHEDFEAAQAKTAEGFAHVKEVIQATSQFTQDQTELNEGYTTALKRFDDVVKGLTSDIHSVPALIQETIKSAVAALPTVEIPEPVPGKPGRDAVEIDILPKIDTAKSYPRGSYARHAGGVWKAYRDTDGMHGWECVLRGIQALTVAMTDERTLVVTSQLSDGEPSAQTIAIPTMLDRGPYSDGKAYEQGDAVTYGGSMWIAQKSEPSGRPGDEGSDGWRLAVRRGRDAKQPVKV